ncbi:HU family DNA-binding protein [[Acholeplasma] multilocale]|uniref:HU family DNA-binding protein n=1 Tax=[Acholeplasma] multilocale TaxID=264638 RepID=UPI0006840BDF|nr:HU family DNA-binding protein [[Acholeplasma] multilocale]
MDIKIVDQNKGKNFINYASAFFLVMFLASFLIGMLIKIINPAVNMDEGLTKDFIYGPTGVISFSTAKFSEHIMFRADFIANIYLLIIAPVTFFIWAVFVIASIYFSGTDVIFTEELIEGQEIVEEDACCATTPAITECEEVKTETPVVEEVKEEVKAKKVEVVKVEQTVLVEATEATKVKKAKIKYPQVSKGQILAKIQEENPEMTKKSVSLIVNELFATMEAQLDKGEEIVINGFGKLSVVDKPERESKNPMNGEVVVVPAHKTAKFKIAKNLKENMNK